MEKKWGMKRGGGEGFKVSVVMWRQDYRRLQIVLVHGRDIHGVVHDVLKNRST